MESVCTQYLAEATALGFVVLVLGFCLGAVVGSYATRYGMKVPRE